MPKDQSYLSFLEKSYKRKDKNCNIYKKQKNAPQTLTVETISKVCDGDKKHIL